MIIIIRSMSLVVVFKVVGYQELACLPRPAITNEVRQLRKATACNEALLCKTLGAVA